MSDHDRNFPVFGCIRWLLVACLGAAVARATPEDDLKAYLQDSLAAVQNVRSAIDESDFDLNARAQSFNKDVAATFEFVHNGIAFEPYAGVMRGAQGCLVSKAGNAADKALLLSELLRREGFKTRLAFGTLSDQTAAQLADEYLRWELDESPRTLELPYTPDDPVVTQRKSDATAALRQHLLQRQQTLTAAVLKALGERAKQAAGGVSIKSFLPDIKSHVWVQVEQGGKYIDLDPCFFDANPGDRFCPADSTADAVPDDAWRQVGFRVFIEKYDGQGVTENTLFESPQKCAELTGVPVMVTVNRTKAQLGGLANGLSAAFGEAPSGDTHVISLTVNGRQLQSAPFTCVPPQKSGGDGGLFGMGGGGGKNGAFVTAVGVEVSFSGPGEHRAPIKRYLLDLWGLAARAAKDIGPLENLNVDAAALTPLDLKEFCFAVEGGTVCPAQIQARLLDTSIANLRAITVANGLVSMAVPAADNSAHNITDTYFHYFDSMASELFERQGFSAGPRVLLAIFDQAGSFKFDVTSDPQRIVTELSLQPFKDQLTTGLLASIVEEELITDPEKPDDAAGANQGCASLLEASLAQGPPTVVDSSAGIPGAASPAGRRLMQSALDAGRLLIIPAGDASGWFELDSTTGAIEAVWKTGLHQDSTETAELEKDNPQKASVASKWRRTIKKLLECATENADTLAQAIIDAHGPGLTYDDAIGLVGAAKDCIAAIRQAHAEARALSNSRKAGVSRAWKQEKDLVEKTGKGTRPWNAKELEELKKNGKVSGYEGHHINSAKKNPGMAGDPNNIKFVNREEHMAEHGGNFGNPTKGGLIDRANGQPPGIFIKVPVGWLWRNGLQPNGTYGETHRYFRLRIDGADWVPMKRPCLPEFSRPPPVSPGLLPFASGLEMLQLAGMDVCS